MRFAMNRFYTGVRFRRFAVSLALLALLGPSLWAAGKSQFDVARAEGSEIWQNDYDVTERKKGRYNVIVYARDRAGNESISGPFNIKVDPKSGLPTARVVYPQNGTIIRENLDILGIAAGRFGISKVMVNLDNGPWTEATGTDYWNRAVDLASVEDGKHSMYVQAFDERGTAGPIERVDFIIDTAAPSIKLTSHKVGDVISGTVNIKGTVSDANGLVTLEYSNDGTNFKKLSGRKHGDAVEFTVSLATKSVTDGPVVVYIRAVDTTGVGAVNPYLFFVDNRGPELELYSPAPGESVFGNFVVSGRTHDSIGIENLYYEWGREREGIVLRPGDPYWSFPLEMVKGSPTSIKITAVDKIGNVSTITAKLEDRRRVKVPVLVVEHPHVTVLSAMPGDASIFGRVDTNVEGQSVVVEGFGEVEAKPSFRIGPEMIPMGKGSLKLTPVAADGTRGTPVTVRYNKPVPTQVGDSRITVTNPAKYGWLAGANFFLSGSADSPGARVEFRLSPLESWRFIDTDSSGSFAATLSMVDLPEGPIHLELRTNISGAGSVPVYHPFNRAISQAGIKILSPPSDPESMVHGSKTVLGTVDFTVPLKSISYSLDRRNFEELPIVNRHGKAWFSYFCDFNELGAQRGRLVFHVTDAANNIIEVIPDFTINPRPPLPTIIVNTPTEDQVITEPFDISGVAFDEVGISGVHWRILGPRMDSISRGPAGAEARHIAELFQREPDVPFNRLLTNQSFQIPIDFETIIDGDYTVEVYAADPYGTRSEVVARTIKVSTAPPETRIVNPAITRYNNQAVLIQGNSTDANGVEEVLISMDNGNTWQTVVLAVDDRWELALNTVAYTDGVYSALVRTVDKCGITTFSNVMINIDNSPPELFISSPQSGQRVGTVMNIVGRVSDNIQLKSLSFQLISAANPNFRSDFESLPQLVVFETMDLSGFPQGEYILRAVAKDLADNESIVSYNVIYDADDAGAQIAIFNPLAGETHTGAINVVGTVTGTSLPDVVEILMDGGLMSLVPVDRYGIFRYQLAESMLKPDTSYRISVSYDGERGNKISSPIHTVYYNPMGPGLMIESHRDGDAITKRPWLSGRAWLGAPPPENGRRLNSKERADRSIKQVEVSYDNGRTFKKAKGGKEWKYRIEANQLPVGPQPIVVRATFGNGEVAVRRILLIVDTTAPQVATIAPIENTVHRDNILVYGTASDNIDLADVDITLRPYSKFWYSIPGPLQGLYFDAKILGATYFDVGLGISLFKDNVRLQAQFGLTPADGATPLLGMIEGGRYTGYAIGMKLLANVFYMPFDYLFGPDWAFYSMNIAVGANFSYFSMHEWEGSLPRDPLVMSAVIAQWDVANIDMQFFYPNWKYFRRFALYLQPEVWFASSDVQVDTTIFRMTIGFRLNFF